MKKPKSQKIKVVSRSGRFSGGPSSDVAAFSESISFDWRLWRQDILGSTAHATMLESIGILSRKECDDIIAGLRAIGSEIEAGSFQWKIELEDVHMNIEAELTRRVPSAAKLHTARSRNDQVALDVRLWLRDEVVALRREVRFLQRSLVQLGARYPQAIIPGYTHLQRAQPVFFAHHCLAYVEMLERDLGRLDDGLERINVCPLGSGAIAGTTLPINRELVAAFLGFLDDRGRPKLTRNSMDGVSDRDFVVEFCSTSALLAVHLSRLAEDVILWATVEFGFIQITDAYTTGSSLMPQKKNPDIAELTRGKSGRVIGNLMSLLVLLKGLPMTYNRDMQEDKERLFDTVDTVRSTTRLMAGMLNETHVREDVCRRAAGDPQLLATDLADYLVLRGLPFRAAHHAVGALVAYAEKSGKTLDQISLPEFQVIEPLFGADVRGIFDLDKAMKRRELIGAPGPKAVAAELRRWNRLLGDPVTESGGSTGKHL